MQKSKVLVVLSRLLDMKYRIAGQLMWGQKDSKTLLVVFAVPCRVLEPYCNWISSFACNFIMKISDRVPEELKHFSFRDVQQY